MNGCVLIYVGGWIQEYTDEMKVCMRIYKRLLDNVSIRMDDVSVGCVDVWVPPDKSVTEHSNNTVTRAFDEPQCLNRPRLAGRRHRS
jgi:hypothetical protein